MIFKSNAKVNFGLVVGDKREDEYHNIQSILLPVYNYFDWIEVNEAVKKGIQITTSGINIPGTPEQNLCYKAYELLSKRYNIPGVKIHLHKNIAIENGFGGGSSNAVTTLVAIDKIFNLNIGREEMMEFAESLGSDCPFFLANKPSIVTGRGEQIQIINFNLEEYMIRVYPSIIAVSTENAFKKSNFEKGLTLDLRKLNDEEKWRKVYRNAFEKRLLEDHPELIKMKADIYKAGAIYASLTGTGAGMFGLFKC